MKDGSTAIAPLSREVLDDFPQLREKAVVEVVNSLEVVGDHLRWRDENPGSICSRVLDVFSGASARRQRAIDRGVEGVLNGMSEWLRSLQAAQVESDIALARVAERLLETRQGVMRLQSRHRELQGEVAELGQRLDELVKRTESEIAGLHEKLGVESAGRRAWNAVERVEARWRSRRFGAIPPLLRTVLAANDLYWGDFGAFLRLNGADGKESRDLVEHAQYTLANLVDGLVASNLAGPVIVESLLEPLEDMTISADWRDAVAYLLEDAPGEVQPLAAAAAMRLQGSKDALPDKLQRLIRPPYLGELAVRETVRRIESEQHDREEAPQ